VYFVLPLDRNDSEPVAFIYYKHMVKRFADRPTPFNINAILVCLGKLFSL